ncbi:6,7-dimethyl-8-ribityllumazine synthase [Legionella fairfieldensis]|uniref:6,7-dimethyl-8-ribityllumazine synthase n=1 Tax=Legionella fairfieldensis TaxID=45064 RepID=UPI00048C40B5|nr:6,7-dimethyl-8-ribityllumazine synthase [Legionella fairfieldensis]
MKHITAEPVDSVESFPIAIVVSHFNRPVTNELQRGALRELIRRGLSEQDITLVEVPGAVEIPLVVQRLAMQKKVAAIIALGAVIRGETSHYDYVCEQVSQGCQRVALDYNIPVIFGVLTTDDEAQAWERLGGRHGHKGIDAADCAIAMQSILTQIDKISSNSD